MAATPGFLIIDARREGLPDAQAYYAIFPAEQSPLGEISLDRSRTLAMQNSSLDVVLGGMLTAGAAATVVLVCHAFSGGMLLPVVSGGQHALAVVDNLAIIDQVIKAEADVAVIRKLPSTTPQEQQTVIDRWTTFLNGLQPNSVSGTFTVKEAEAFYARWQDMVAKKLDFQSRTALLAFIAKVLRVRNLKLSRVELRACNIGDHADSMEAVRKFFGAEHLTAPTVGTFYMSLIPVSTMAVRARPRGNPPVQGRGATRRNGVLGAGSRPGPVGERQGIEVISKDGEPSIVISRLPAEIDLVSDRQLEQQTGHTTRAFFQRSFMWFGPALSGVHITTFHTFLLTIDEIQLFHYRGSASVFSTGDGVTPDWAIVREFVQGWVLPSATYHQGPFPVAGLWTPDIKDVPFVLPFETMYVGLIAQSPAATP